MSKQPSADQARLDAMFAGHKSGKRPNALQAPLQAKPRPGGICFDDSPCGESNWWCTDCPNKQRIKRLALDAGFSVKQQPDGSMDLNPYVYKFAAALTEAVKADAEWDQGEKRMEQIGQNGNEGIGYLWVEKPHQGEAHDQEMIEVAIKPGEFGHLKSDEGQDDLLVFLQLNET